MTGHLLKQFNRLMHMKHFGDSYDLVKQSLLRWLAKFGAWSVHPMFTEGEPSAEEVAAFGSFLNDATVISSEVLTTRTNRAVYFSSAHSFGNLFLDPTTGVRIGSGKQPNYLYSSELIGLAEKRDGFLTLAFDQSIARGQEKLQLEAKLRLLAGHGISSFAYLSHACFIVAGCDDKLIEEAKRHALKESRLPKWRFLEISNKGRAAHA